MHYKSSSINLTDLLQQHAGDVLSSEGMQKEKDFCQHGGISCYDHSVAVAQMSVRMAQRLRLRVDMESLIRGALLHDYFLYDWHDGEKEHNLHGSAMQSAHCATLNGISAFSDCAGRYLPAYVPSEHPSASL